MSPIFPDCFVSCQVLIGLGGKALSLNAIAERVDDALKQVSLVCAVTMCAWV